VSILLGLTEAGKCPFGYGSSSTLSSGQHQAVQLNEHNSHKASHKANANSQQGDNNTSDAAANSSAPDFTKILYPSQSLVCPDG